jgi:hypothetical protein
MADAKISALPSAGTLADTDVLALVNGGGTTQVSLNTLTAYFESRARQNNASVAQLTLGAVDVYATGSDVPIPSGRLQAKSMYRARMEVTKTSVAGVATPIVTMRFGTAGSTADASLGTLTFAAQTAVADTGFLEVFATFRTVGSGTTAVIAGTGVLDHTLAATGLSTANVSVAKLVSAGFNSTLASARIGFSVNFGTSFTGTSNMTQAELFNLA